jgi:hypothetical protein
LKTNAGASALDGHIHALGGSPLKFPKSIAEMKGNGGDLEGIGFKLTDCSDRELVCVGIVQVNWDEPRLEYKLVVPRHVKPMQEYSKDGVKVITRRAFGTLEDREPMVQATLWQRINGEEVAMELTLHPKRGVVFWDGIRLASSAAELGELCVLVSETGLFSGTEILR